MDGAKGMLVLVVFLMLKSYSKGLPTVPSRCEELVTPMCKSLGYNYTAIPNILGQRSQHEAALRLYQFSPLVKIGCSPYLRQFLCSVYLPMCKSDGSSFLPCQFLCEQSLKDCSRIMGRFGLTWPNSLNCSKFQDSPGTCKRTGKQSGIDSQSYSPSNSSNPQDGDDDDDFTDESGSGELQVPSPVLPRCERLTILPCTKLYNTTILPNFFNHTNQYEAALQLGQLYPLVSASCYKYIAEFLCSLYAPKCRLNGFLPPCRSFCEEAKRGCLPVMSEFGLSWPAALNCSMFHNKSGGACVGKPSAPWTPQPRCEKMTIPQCQDLGYNYTSVPNFFNQSTQNEAARSIGKLYPLVSIGCSKYLKKFLCSLYAPKCRANGFLPPCRSICEEAREGCRHLLYKFGFRWPATLDCSQFHNRRRGPCIERSSRSRSTAKPSSSPMSVPTTKQPRPTKQSRCKPLNVPMCRGLRYNYTVLPNFLNHESLREVRTNINIWRPIMKTGCSNYLKQFLCTVHAPPCTVVGVRLPPCRSICEKAQRECSSVLSKFGLSWPSDLNCSLFPYRGKGLVLCIDMSSGSKSTIKPPSRTTPRYGGSLTSIQGTLTTPNYPNQYPTDAHITWKITLPPPYNMVEISINDMQLEEDRNCFFDYVMVLDKMLNQVGPSLCGTFRQPYIIRVRGNEASIVFVSDKNTSKKGFSLIYKGLIS